MFLHRSIKSYIRIFEINFFKFGQIKQFVLPDLGEKIKEATIKKWHVKEGDMVEEFQGIADVATDKLFTTIPASFKGKIHKRFHKEDDPCLVGEPFLEIEIEDSNTLESVQKKEEIKSEQAVKVDTQTKIVSKEKKTEIFASPAVRHLIKLNKIDIGQIHGTGKDGRITKDDVNKFINNKDQSKSIPSQEQKKKDNIIPSNLEKQTIKMSDFKKGMQKSMTLSNTIPHFYLKEEIDLTSLVNLREELKKENISVTYMPFIVKAFSMSLTEFPIINSSYDVEKPFEYTMIPNHNISIAVDSPKGLVVPNIKNCQNLSVLQIQQELTRLRKESEEGKLGPKDLFEGTVSISNIGNICGTYLGPLILPPQVCIVAIGRIQLVPKYIKRKCKKTGVEKNVLEPRSIMNVSFGCDHRVLDGATVAKFCVKWKKYLEHPGSLLINLK